MAVLKWGTGSTSHIVRDPDLKIQTANGDKISVGEEEGARHVCKHQLQLGMLLYKTNKSYQFFMSIEIKIFAGF